jgi:predicted NAD/FAD-dependent oxidoreductase
VVGAGISGLLAAHALQDVGFRVLVLERGAEVGGRMATCSIEGGVFDCGAQFMTVRDWGIQCLIEQWIGEGVVKTWCRGFPSSSGPWEGGGHPRYCGVRSMASIPGYLSRGLDVRLNEELRQVRIWADGVYARTPSGLELTVDGLLLTPPLPQSLALLKAGGVPIPDAQAKALNKVSYHPTLAVLLLLDGASDISEPGGLRFEDGPIRWMADNRRKGISPAEFALTVHMSHTFSRAYWDRSDEEIVDATAAAALPWLGSRVQRGAVRRWRFGCPKRVHPERCALLPGPPPIAIAGDAFADSRVEGAALSGLAAAERLATELRN